MIEENQPTYRLLIVDDNKSIHYDFKKILTQENNPQKEAINELHAKLFGETKSRAPLFPRYEIDSAFQGEEAVKMIKKSLEERRPYALAFVDILMPPGMDGIVTIRHIWDIDPNIQIVICTAYGEYSWEEILAKFGVNDNFLILKKPFEIIEIRQMANCLTKKWALANR